MRRAKGEALKSNIPQAVNWRTYQTIVHPSGPKFTEKELKRLLSVALEKMNDETEVLLLPLKNML